MLNLKKRLTEKEQISRNEKIAELNIKKYLKYFNSVSESNLIDKLKEPRARSLSQLQAQGTVGTFSSPPVPVLGYITENKPDSPSKRV